MDKPRQPSFRLKCAVQPPRSSSDHPRSFPEHHPQCVSNIATVLPQYSFQYLPSTPPVLHQYCPSHQHASRKPKETQEKTAKHSAPLHHRNESAMRQPLACAHKILRNATKTIQNTPKTQKRARFLMQGFVLSDIIFNEGQHFPLKTHCT